MRNLTLTSFLALIFLLSACSEYISEGDHFFIRSKGADMPAIVSGDMGSDVFIIFLHGGPGGNATTASFLPVFQELEEDYALVYWDQRASGLSQGNPDPETFTVEQFVDDLDLLVDVINKRYSSPKIFLFGHSWGGALGCAYLSTGDLQEKITGFINTDSGHNLLEGLPKSVDWLEAHADSLINAGVRASYWQDVKLWCSTNPDMTDADNYFEYADYIIESEAYLLEPDSSVKAEVGFDGVFLSYMSLAGFFNGPYLAERFNILELNLSPQMSVINTPTAVFWGRHDGINTLEMGWDAYNSIGDSTFNDKRMIIYDDSAHQPFLEEDEKFILEFKLFVEQYK